MATAVRAVQCNVAAPRAFCWSSTSSSALKVVSSAEIDSTRTSAALHVKLKEATAYSHPVYQCEIPRIVARGGRSLLYEETDTYVLLEPGEEEVFVNEDELRERLKSWLVKWPAKELPEDLALFATVDDVVNYLVDSACELDVGGGLGSVQWYEVRLE